MRRLLRGVINFDDGKLTSEALSSNFLRLNSTNIEWVQPIDGQIFTVVREFFTDTYEVPSGQTILDFFQRTNNVEAVERLEDLKTAPVYSHKNYEHLLKQLLEDQNRLKMQLLLKDTAEIVSKGLIVGQGREKQQLRGTKDALQYLHERANELIPPDTNARTRGNLRDDTEAGWEEYQTAKFNKDRVWGRFTGLNEIDKVCHGLKRGELWIHAAYAGELKCLAGDSTIYDHRTQQRRTIAEMFASGDLPTVTALDREGETHRLVHAEASHLVQNGVREVFNLALSSGRSVGATSNHKFFTPDGWKELGDLKVGDFVAVPRIMRRNDSDSLFTDSEVKILGYLLGDGCIKGQELSLTASNEVIRKDFMACLSDLGLREGNADYVTPAFHVSYSEGHAPAVRMSKSRGLGNSPMTSPVRALLESLGMWGWGSETKRIPDELWSLPDRQVRLLLGALWSTDGSCHTGDHKKTTSDTVVGRNDVSYSSVSHKLCLDIQSLLLLLGIQSSVTQVDTTYKDEHYTFYCTRVVGNVSKRKFASTIAVVGKEERFAKLLSRLPLVSGRKIPSSFVPANRKVPKKGYQAHSNGLRLRATATVETAAKFVTEQDTELNEAIVGDLDWDTVKSIEFRGEEMTYDLSVPVHHTFVVNDIISHNTTLAMNWAYNLVTRYRTNVFYVSMEMPFDQIRRILYTIHSGNAKWAAMGKPPLDYRKIRDGELSPEEEAFYQEVLHDFQNNPEHCRFEVWAPDKDVTIDDIRVEAELKHKEMEIGMVILDHGGLMKAKKAHKDYTIELNSVLRDSKKFALHFNGGEGMATLMLFQINRQGKDDADKNAGRYKMKALSYSNEAERSADYITTTYLNEQHRENLTTIICNLKNRDNPMFEPFLASIDFTSRRIFNHDSNHSCGSGISAEDVDQVMDAI